MENYIEWEEVDPVESSGKSSLKLRVPHAALGDAPPGRRRARSWSSSAPRDRTGILTSLDDERAADVIEELRAEDQVDVLEALPA